MIPLPMLDSGYELCPGLLVTTSWNCSTPLMVGEQMEKTMREGFGGLKASNKPEGFGGLRGRG